MNYNNITVAGSGVLGSQIAFQTAFHGYNVSVFDINDEVLNKAKERFTGLKDVYATYFNDEAKAAAALERLTFSSDLKEAVKDADLVIEAIPEVLEIKKSFYEKLAVVAQEKTVFASNSSTMVPSQFAEFTGRPEKFLALHFANEIWKNNVSEVMGHAGTDKKYEVDVIEFATSIGMVPLHILKEQPGYIMNSLLVPFLTAGLDLWAREVAHPETIDKTWMLSFGAPQGPFAMIDVVGIETAYNVVAHIAKTNPTMQLVADLLKTEFIDKGKTGQGSGEGFYKYPNPRYLDEDFLKA